MKRLYGYCLYDLALLLMCVTNSFATTVDAITLQQILVPQVNDARDLNGSAGVLSLSGSGTIRFLQALFYSDTSCSTLLDGVSVIDNVTGMSFTNGQSISLNASSIYQLAINKGIDTTLIGCMKVFVSGSNESSQGVACQSFTDETCDVSSCTSSQIKSVSWSTNPAVCTTRYLYTPGTTGNQIRKCTIDNTTGSLSNNNCVSTTTSFAAPRGTVVNNYYLYAANTIGSGTIQLSKCTVSATDGSLSNCAATGDISFHTPRGIVLNNQYCYIADTAVNAVYQCSVSATDGSLSNCTIAASGFNTPRGMALSNGYLYVVNAASTVFKCAVNAADGTLSSCGDSGGTGFNNPYAIALSDGYAYVGNLSGGGVTQCSMNASDGSLSTCSGTEPASIALTGVSIYNGFAYLSKNAGGIELCSVDSSYQFTSCSASDVSISASNLNYIF